MIEFFGDPSKAVKIGSSLDPPFERDLINFLKEHSDVFAWEASDMQGISPEVMVYRLNVHPEARPIKQKKRAFGTDRNKIIKEKVEKLLKVNYIRPVQYLEWLANVVLVPKSNENWRMCIDFMDLNRACPKDSFPLHRIDAMIDSTSECFEILKKFGMKLNPSKCTFGVREGNFLGFMVSQRGIEANPEKIEAIIKMQPPNTAKEVQKLAGRIAALNRLSPGGSKCGTGKRRGPRASTHILCQQEPEERYPQIEKLALALVTAARKLRPYFQSHPMVVLTNHSLKKILADPNISGRMVKWSIELSEHDIEYQPRPTIKAQSLVDFISELTGTEDPKKSKWWKIFVDGSSTSLGSGAGIVIETPQGDRLQYAIKFDFVASNNEAEYEALIAGEKLALAAGAKPLKAHSDSQLVVNQIRGDYEAKGSKMTKYLSCIQTLMRKFDEFAIEQIPRSKNEEADQLARLASSLTLLKSRSITFLSQERS
ncbi:UNVERIFIED_CONTAM: Ribonuclease HI [Sesamum latifolium]|uniref:Ribonuclease HI n=1 Tax=Sesamum latifolium TaxID=2727402 RepID=A0AAW2WEY0_9LAMI